VVKFERNGLINNVFGTATTSTFRVFDTNFDDGNNFVTLSAKHNAYKENFNYIHQRTIKIDKKNNDLLGEDNLISTNENSNLFNMYSIRFHLYPGINAVQTMSKNSILIQIEKNKSLIFTTSEDNLILEKSIFLGRDRIINNFCMTISGSLNRSENKNISWKLKRSN
tara:strand:- start:471 stop:971 length:501 start_codon:yes stop_codon:yes gene_type:complete